MRYAVEITTDQYGDSSREVFATYEEAVEYQYELLDSISDMFLEEHLDYEETNADDEFNREDSIQSFRAEVLRYIDVTEVE